MDAVGKKTWQWQSLFIKALRSSAARSGGFFFTRWTALPYFAFVTQKEIHAEAAVNMMIAYNDDGICNV